ERLAAEVRLNLYEYTIAVDGKPWDKTFPTVWEPIFHPVDGSVTAPVRVAGKWTLANDGEILWSRMFTQAWHQQYSADGKNLAAIVAPEYGKWTVAVNGAPWSTVFGDLVADLTFSPDGARAAALGKEGEAWGVVVDGSRWTNAFDMAWKPVFSPDGAHVAARVEKKGKYTIALDDRLWEKAGEAAWDPVFSPGGDKLLLRSIENGVYHRRVINVSDFATE
ncbi:MAG: WD40 repeat domain-containing protein, partial [Desulfobacterales bacterium]|nr:WD40 repeat domain-containing protein [Desulfobacterales bacterium]